MNVLLVGLGRWGEKHVRVLRELGVDLWVADVSAERRTWAVERGIKSAHAVRDFRDAVDAVHAVDIVTPADSHAAVAEPCLKAGRHCFVEKPLAMTVAEGRALAAAAAEADRVLQVGHIFRFHPVTAALRDALSKQRLGAVRFATGRFAGFKRPRTDVGVGASVEVARAFARDDAAIGSYTGLQRDHRRVLGNGHELFFARQMQAHSISIH